MLCRSKCAACGSYDGAKSRYTFPKDIHRRELWLKILKITDTEKLSPYSRVCSDHFRKSQFKSPSCIRLKSDALPYDRSSVHRPTPDLSADQTASPLSTVTANKTESAVGSSGKTRTVVQRKKTMPVVQQPPTTPANIILLPVSFCSAPLQAVATAGMQARTSDPGIRQLQAEPLRTNQDGTPESILPDDEERDVKPLIASSVTSQVSHPSPHPPLLFHTSSVVPKSSRSKKQWIPPEIQEKLRLKDLKIKRLQMELLRIQRRRRVDPFTDAQHLERIFGSHPNLLQFIKFQYERVVAYKTAKFDEGHQDLAFTIYSQAGRQAYRTLLGLGIQLPSIASMKKYSSTLRVSDPLINCETSS